ncbi:hypothetical protein ACIGKQ_22275 [Gordonia sp. NPDC062954]|uniref:hypothetical protein n=1 Tax=Gordonia sp. NPDC062954 TaxID=3364003 RepID=UPI0037C8C4D9
MPIEIDVTLPAKLAQRPPVAWFPIDTLAPGQRTVSSGRWFAIPTSGTVERKNNRMQYRGAPVTFGARGPDSWCVLVTDTAARDETKGAYFVAGRDFDETVEVPPETWDQYLESVASADDLREENAAAGRMAPVYWPKSGAAPRLRGFRYRVRQRLEEGQPVWVKVNAGRQATEIRSAQLWRHRGDLTVGERIPSSLAPCSDSDELCPSCQLFGSAEIRDSGVDVREQKSYRGHVCFSDAIAQGNITRREWIPAALRSPKPTAGQFYLDNSSFGTSDRIGSETDAVPRSAWGSQLDQVRSRSISGRKFYWRTSEPIKGEHPRGGAHRFQIEAGKADDAVNLVDPDATFRYTVSFDGIRRDQLGGLLAALAPAIVLGSPDKEIVTSIGGGKPFGFGAVSSTISGLTVEGARHRYLGGHSEDELDVTGFATEFATSIPESGKSEWPMLERVLTLGAVGDNLVRYPQSSSAAAGVNDESESAFEFWQSSRGLGRPATKLVDLPQVQVRDQRIQLDAPKDGV